MEIYFRIDTFIWYIYLIHRVAKSKDRVTKSKDRVTILLVWIKTLVWIQVPFVSFVRRLRSGPDLFPIRAGSFFIAADLFLLLGYWKLHNFSKRFDKIEKLPESMFVRSCVFCDFRLIGPVCQCLTHLCIFHWQMLQLATTETNSRQEKDPRREKDRRQDQTNSIPNFLN